MTAKTVLVTGASSGIGEAAALRLARTGWRVFAGVRRDDDGVRLRAQAGSLLTPLRIDVTDEAGVVNALQEVGESSGGRLDALVNNAGVARGGPVEALPLDEWREQLEVNVIGQVAVTKEALPLLREAHGRVVFIGSIAGRVASALLGPYCASKHALEALADVLRDELRPWGIAVSIVEPGVVKTPIWSKSRSKADELEAALAAEHKALYRDQIDDLRRTIEKNDRRGAGAETVAAVVEDALESRRPRPRYLVGPDAVVAGNLARVLPDRARIALFRRLTQA